MSGPPCWPKRPCCGNWACPTPTRKSPAWKQELLKEINDLGIGPQGLGGRITALAVHVLMQPCHIASLPVAVNIQCHASRHKEVVL